ncbi:MAG: gliding motility protein GldM [Bacteroidales bacterium]|nr:gliding motility protein GldM [Bacteroidales bacterium]
MAGYKETPRQKMIAMMYLVLTALLALNVSVEILDAFIVVNESMETTNEKFSTKIESTYDRFEKQYNINQKKVGPYWEKAKLAQKYSNDLINYIDSIKYEVIAKTEGITVEQAKEKPLRDIKARDKYDYPTNFFIGNSQDGSKGEARVLKNKLNEYRERLLSLIEPENRNRIQLGLSTEGPYHDASGAKQNWEMHNFYHTILAADVTILNKIIAEVQNAEFDVVNHLFNAVTAEDFKFDEIDAKIIPKSNYVLKGDKYEAEVFVAAYDTKQDPEVYILPGADTITPRNIDQAQRLPGKKGKVSFDLPAESEGAQRYAGMIKVQGPSGQDNRYYFSDEYIVERPFTTVSATKMNVFYVGVDNPVSISAPGVAVENLEPRISKGNLNPDPSGRNWIVTLPDDAKGRAVITVMARVNGGLRNMGKQEFRIKQVPSPEPYIANVPGGQVSKEALMAAGAIIPRMPRDFDFDLYFEITSFEFVSVRQGDIVRYTGNGNKLSPEMLDFIESASNGDKIWLEDIRATGPGGSRSLSPLSIEIQ